MMDRLIRQEWSALLILALVFCYNSATAWQFVNGTWLLESGGGESALMELGVHQRDVRRTRNKSLADKGRDMKEDLSIKSLQSVLTTLDQNRPVIVTCFTASLLELYYNFVCHLKSAGIASQHIVYALDNAVYDTLEADGAPVIKLSSVASTPPDLSTRTEQEYIHGTHSFARLSYLKLYAVQHALTAFPKYGILYSDVDVVFLRSPFAHINPDFDMQFASDYVVESAGVSLAKDTRYLCTGIFYAKGHVALQVLQAAISFGARPKNSRRDDQIAVNAVLSSPRFLKDGRYPANTGLFDGLSFTNGYTYFHRHLPQRIGVDPVAIHANYILGKNLKRQHMMLHGLWQWMKNSRKCLIVDARLEREVVGFHEERDYLRRPLSKVAIGNQSAYSELENSILGQTGKKWLVMTCSKEEGLLYNFYSHIQSYKNNLLLCSFLVGKTGLRVSAAHSMNCNPGSLLIEKATPQMEKEKELFPSENICNLIQMILLDNILHDFTSTVSGVLWADPTTVFNSHPLLPVLQDKEDMDLIVAGGWQPRSVLGSSESGSLRAEASIARRLRHLKYRDPRIDADMLYLKVNKKILSLFERAVRPYREEVLSIDLILDVEVGIGRCLVDEKGALKYPPGSKLLHACNITGTTKAKDRVAWGMLDPLFYVNSRHLQLAKDASVPIKAVRFLSKRTGKENFSIEPMLLTNLWRETGDKLHWKDQWSRYMAGKQLHRQYINLDLSQQRRGINLLEQVLRESKFNHACVLSKSLIDIMTPLLIVLQHTAKNSAGTVHYLGDSSRVCKDSGQSYSSLTPCAAARRFLMNRAHDHFMFHGMLLKENTSPSLSDLKVLVSDTAQSYPFIKCELVLFAEDCSGLVKDVYGSGLATQKAKFVSLDSERTGIVQNGEVSNEL